MEPIWYSQHTLEHSFLNDWVNSYYEILFFLQSPMAYTETTLKRLKEEDVITDQVVPSTTTITTSSSTSTTTSTTTTTTTTTSPDVKILVTTVTESTETQTPRKCFTSVCQLEIWEKEFVMMFLNDYYWRGLHQSCEHFSKAQFRRKRRIQVRGKIFMKEVLRETGSQWRLVQTRVMFGWLTLYLWGWSDPGAEPDSSQSVSLLPSVLRHQPQSWVLSPAPGRQETRRQGLSGGSGRTSRQTSEQQDHGNSDQSPQINQLVLNIKVYCNCNTMFKLKYWEMFKCSDSLLSSSWWRVSSSEYRRILSISPWECFHSSVSVYPAAWSN